MSVLPCRADNAESFRIWRIKDALRGRVEMHEIVQDIKDLPWQHDALTNYSQGWYSTGSSTLAFHPVNKVLWTLSFVCKQCDWKETAHWYEALVSKISQNSNVWRSFQRRGWSWKSQSSWLHKAICVQGLQRGLLRFRFKIEAWIPIFLQIDEALL